MRASIAITQLNRRWCRGAVLLALCVAVAFAFNVARAAEPEENSALSTWRLRVAWGGGEATRWRVRASLDQGELRDLVLLGRQRDTPGSVWLANGQVHGLQPRPRQFEGFDITAVADTKATLRVELMASGRDQPRVLETTIEQLLVQQQRLGLDDTGNTLLVHRANDDVLRLKVDDDNLIFTPEETLAFTVEPALVGVAPGSSLDLSVELVEGRKGASLHSESQRITLPARGSIAVPWQIKLPAAEGVYTIELIARHPPGNRVPFWGATSKQDQLASRKFQVIVLTPRHATRFSDPQWTTLVEIDPANPRWWNRLPDWSRLGRWTGASSGPTGNRPFRTSQYEGKTLAELPAATPGDAPWQAYLLAHARPGEPHLVEIEFPSDQPLEVALRIYEEDAQGQLQPAGAQRGTAIDQWSPTSEKSMVTHRMLFWPRTNSPILVVQNAHAKNLCRYGAIRLKHAKATSGDVVSRDRADGHPLLARFSWEGLIERMAVGRRDNHGRAEVDDRQTFFDAAQRLADFLELGGYSGAVVTVLGDGGSACLATNYPLTPRYNSHVLGTGTCDLPPLDPMEILLEVLGQRGLTLTPSLCFNYSLPGLEAETRKNSSGGIPWVVTDATGRARNLGSDDAQSSVPHYDYSEGYLAREIIAVCEGLLERYGHHPALGDMAIELTADSYLVLPPLPYGLTADRVNEVAAALNIDQQTRTDWLEDPRKMLADPRNRLQLARLRAGDPTRLWQHLAQRLEQAPGDKKLILLYDQMFDSREYQGLVRPRLYGGTKLEELLLERGLDLETLAQMAPRVTIPATTFDTAGVPLADAATAMHLSEMAIRPDLLSMSGLSVAKRKRRLLEPAVNGDAASVYRPLAFDRVGPAEYRRLMAHWRHAVSGPVLLGSESGPGGDVLSTRASLGIVRQLSQSPTRDIISEQPLTLYVSGDGTSSTVTAINPTPWPMTATVTLDVGAAGPARRVALGANDLQATYSRGKHAWPLTLGPYGMEGMVFTNAKVAVSGVQSAADEQPLKNHLQSRLDELLARDLSARQPYHALANPSFEELDSQGNPIGWKLESESPASSYQSSHVPGFHESRALRLASEGRGMAAVSEPFAVPPTGQLALVVFVRPENLAEDAEFRLVMEEVGPGASPRHAPPPLTATQLLTHKTSQEWIGYRFGVEELPLDSASRMRLRFELVGRGEIAIDAIELYEVVFPLDLYPRDSEYQRLAIAQRIESARAALDERRYSDCLYELDAYWARFLLEHLPPLAPVAQQAASDPLKPAVDSPPPQKVGGRLRDWFNFR